MTTIRRILYWLVILLAVSHTLVLGSAALSGIADLDMSNDFEVAGWAIGTMIGLVVFWLMPSG
jgi:hypothetical protein